MKLLIVALLLICANCFAYETKPEKRDHVIASLVSDHDSVTKNQNLKIGLKFVIEKGWHVYWRNPGDSGTSPRIQWQVPAGMEVSEFRWPTPHVLPIEPLANYGYEKEIVLPMDVKFSGDRFDLVGKAEWLVCKIECLPGSAEFELILPVGEEKISDNGSKDIENALSLNPIAKNDISVKLKQDSNSFFLTFSSQDIDLKSFSKAYFFPYNGTYIAHAAPQKISFEGSNLKLTIKKSDSLIENPKSMDGVLALEKENEPRLSFEITSRAKSSGQTIWMALIFAFLGGIILNLMPCVFPVISIKILGFVDSSQKTDTQISAHGWAYTVGVLISFLILSGALLVLRSLGQSLGWGFQLQSPYFITFMIILFFMIGLNLLGVFEVGEGFAGVGSKISRQKDYVGSFFTGILATLVATPCTAPFMGSALGFAVTLPPVQSVLIFLVLGFGMAFPYLVLSYFPSLIKKLPRPGPWMKIFKEVLAFPMMLTVLWLMWVLSLQAGAETLIYILLFLVAVSFVIWLQKNIKTAWFKWLLILFSLISTGYYLYKNIHSSSPTTVAKDDVWKPYSEERLQELKAQGKPVFVDFTAAWCITCQVNKKVVLNTEKIQLAFKNAGVVLMKADWTNQDPVITKALSAFDRNSVPLYVLYGKDKPIILPEILTDDIVLNSLKKL